MPTLDNKGQLLTQVLQHYRLSLALMLAGVIVGLHSATRHQRHVSQTCMHASYIGHASRCAYSRCDGFLHLEYLQHLVSFECCTPQSWAVATNHTADPITQQAGRDAYEWFC